MAQQDIRLMYWFNTYAQAMLDHKGGKVEPEDFNQKIDTIEAECRETYGTTDPFYNYLKLNYNHDNTFKESKNS